MCVYMCYFCMYISFCNIVNISNVNCTTNISIALEPVIKYMRQQLSGPDSLSGKSIRHESEGWVFESPLGRDNFCL